jgi:hypothetical protein
MSLPFRGLPYRVRHGCLYAEFLDSIGYGWLVCDTFFPPIEHSRVGGHCRADTQQKDGEKGDEVAEELHFAGGSVGVVEAQTLSAAAACWYEIYHPSAIEVRSVYFGECLQPFASYRQQTCASASQV